ncbi:MAG TPA: primosomal protein N' [Candidatus Binatia bacterium]|nr:primosomal protein N' [Candidatus Binatia bacterium]
MNRRAGKFARIIIPSPLKEPLVYRLTDELRHQVAPGMRVVVPLGKRKLTGIVLDLIEETDVAGTKEIIATQDEQPVLDVKLLQLSRWIARYYSTALGQVIGTVLPPSLKSESERTAVATSSDFAGTGALEKKILQAIRSKKGGMRLKALQRSIPGSGLYPTLERLQSNGAIEIRDRWPGQRTRHAAPSVGEVSPPKSQPTLTLTAEQASVLAVIGERLENGGFETFLLHGATGSGKTEVYLQVMERVRQQGRRSLILIPEISLTPQLIDRLNGRFPGRVGILHSALTGSDRSSQWWQIARGNVDVVVGARSAVFAPLPDLGVLIVDEEHDPSYKQEEGLRYNGRDVAVMRGKLSNCPVLLGSATPAVESYQNSLQGRYRLLQMRHRVQERPLPSIEIVDLRTQLQEPAPRETEQAASLGNTVEGEHDQDGLISNRFAELLKENYKKSRQSLIFLNRRGFANFLQCSTCGYVLRCSYCSVTLTLHLDRKNLCCHHCNFRRPATRVCPECSQLSLSGMGVGTERIEKSVHRLVPEARIARMDRDTTGKRGSHERFIRRWEDGDIDILIGTQMITKGHDVTRVTLVGALLADLSLNLPDFRAAERTFQLLTQVAGRAGRGDDPGQVVIQTFSPDHYAIKYLTSHDYPGFFASEIEFRRELNYPPFSRLINLRIDGPKPDKVEAAAKLLAARLRLSQRKATRLSDVEILGPAPAPIRKLRNRYRWQLLLKGDPISALLDLAQHARAHLPRSHSTRLQIDVDPYNML